MSTYLFEQINSIISSLDTSSIPETRKQALLPLTAYIKQQAEKNNPINLNFICTHNSRRSHLSQVWAQALGYYYNIPNLHTYSGGTEATALFPVAADTLSKQGFDVSTIAEGNNPIYSIKCGDSLHPIIGFSKVYSDNFNPQGNYAAILTCNNADQGCPIVSGAEVRIPITFEDPKAFDGTPLQTDKYAERSLQIATELKYAFEQTQ